MAIRYDSALNDRLRNVVRNYNKRIKRAEIKGIKNLPELMKVKDIKEIYNSRADLDREIKRLEKIRKTDLTVRSTKPGGARGLNWQFDFVKANIEAALNYYNQEYARFEKRTGRFPGERMHLNNINAKRIMLSKDINTASESEFRSMLAAVNEFHTSYSAQKARYRGFLSEVEWVMDITGISNEAKDKFFKKFQQLTPTQFLYAYDNNDIINKIYSLYQKTYSGDVYLTDPENAEDLINQLLEEADEIVSDAKQNSL